MTASTTPDPLDAAAGPSRTVLPVADGAQVRRRLRTLLRGRWTLASVTVLTLTAGSVVGLAGPVAIGWIAQAAVDRKSPTTLIGPVALLVLAAFAAAATGWAGSVLIARLVLPPVGTLREEAIAAAVRLPIDTIERGGRGDLVSRVAGDAELVADAATGAVTSFVGAGLTILVTLGGLAALDWRFAVAGLLAVPIQAHALRWYLRESRPIYAAGRAADGRRAAALLAGFTMLPTLRTLRLGPRHRDRIAHASAESIEFEVRATRAATRFYGRLNVAEFVGLGTILLTASILVGADAATVGAATTAALFFAGLFNPVNTVLGVFDSVQQAGAGLARLIGVDTAPDRARPGPGTPDHAARAAASGTLRVEAVDFGYPGGPPVLHDINLTVPPGGHLAVVGATGSGKSTLASLLAGLRSPRSGKISLGGTNLDAAGAGSPVALVTQETHLLAGTVADNLRLARPDATVDDIESALRTVQGWEWVAALPQGADTLVGSGGHAISAVHAQQLALARIILLDPPVVVLDEATAEAGSDQSRSLDRAARAVTIGRSAVIVAHRLTQATDADQIIVMESGRIVERGSHAELLAAHRRYAALWTAWSAARAVDQIQDQAGQTVDAAPWST